MPTLIRKNKGTVIMLAMLARPAAPMAPPPVSVFRIGSICAASAGDRFACSKIAGTVVLMAPANISPLITPATADTAP